jgi:hypothetical protein
MTTGLENIYIKPAQNYAESLELQKQQFDLSERLRVLRSQSRDHTKMNAKTGDFSENQREIARVTEVLKQLHFAVESSSREAFVYSEQLFEQPEHYESKEKVDSFITKFDEIIQLVSQTDKRFVAKIKNDVNYKELSKNNFQIIKRYFLGESMLKELISSSLTAIKNSIEEMSKNVIDYFKQYPNVHKNYSPEQIFSATTKLSQELQQLINRL